MRREDVNYGQNIHSNDDTIIKVHHIGDNGEVHYFAYADNARGRMGKEPYKEFYGYIDQCYPTTPSESLWLERWIIQNTK